MVNPVKMLARASMGTLFVLGGINQLTSPAMLAPVVETAQKKYGLDLPVAPQQLIQLNGLGMVAAGAGLALGVRPRMSALVLAGLLQPTNLVGHAFWDIDDPEQQFRHRNEFFANVAITGGLLMAVLDRDASESSETVVEVV